MNPKYSPIIQALLIALIINISSAFVVKKYPLGQDYFQKIYVIYHNEEQYYLTIACKDRDVLSISLTPQKQFIQSPAFNIYGTRQDTPNMGKNNYTFLSQCHAIVQVNSSNYLQVKRPHTSQAIFVLGDLLLKKNRNQFTVYDQSLKWGFGQRFQRHFHVVDGRWAIWNRDKPWKIDQGKPTISDQTYSHHPVYLARQKESKQYHLTYFKNTHGLVMESTKNSSHMVYHSIGGNIHFLIFIGKADPEQLIERYHDYIGRSHIPPFWSFGNHQSRWGYNSFADIQKVVKGYNQNDIPLDTIWSDLQYMQQKRIFTINEKTHPPSKMNEFFKQEELHFIPLLDVAISIADKVAVDQGKELNVFLKSISNNHSEYVGEVWPGKVYFIDFLHPNASVFWKNQLSRLHKKLNFSGIWLDMNEPTNFKGGQFLSFEQQPYKIQINENLNAMTINTELLHYNRRNSDEPLKHREVHAYYGHLSTVPTFQYLSNHGRPFIISRSTSVGSGLFAGHWTGDNVATWDFLRLSISGNFLFQIFGIQMVGADICGFYQSATEELCSRWYQIGAFYPFSRNHNHHQARSQQPYAFGADLLQASRQSLKMRYALLKQLYSIYLSKKGRGSYYRPLIFEFYDDELAFQQETVQTQILIGKYIMTAPIVDEGFYQRDVYFPGPTEQWYKFQLNSHTGKVNPDKIVKYLGRSKQVVKNPIQSAPPTFLRGGYMILTNYPQNRSVKLNSQFHIFASLKLGKSKGSILGISNYNQQLQIKECIENDCVLEFMLVKIGYQKFSLSWNYIGKEGTMGSIKIKSILVVGEDKKWRHDAVHSIEFSKGELELQIPLIN